MHGAAVESMAPLLVAAVSPRVRKPRTVADAVQNARWVRNISGSLFIPALVQYISLWSRVQELQLSGEPDRFIWECAANQQYSATSACRALFLGQFSIPRTKELTKVRANPHPPCKFFLWFALLGRSVSSGIICLTTGHARCTLKKQRPCSTYWSIAGSLAKFGSRFCIRRATGTLFLRRTMHSPTGGCFSV
jgi:hypothetical protein